jgi:hypothetical protein
MMKPPVVLALDLATTTGWALHRPGMPRPFFGSERLPGKPHEVGAAADRLERLLRELYIAHREFGGITHFFFEAQHVSEQMNIDTVYKLIALGGIVEKFAFQVKAHVYKVSIAEWRKHFIGRGSGFGSKGLDPKELAIQRCAQYGWHTDVSDEAEALGILDYCLTMIPDYVRPWRDAALLGGMASGA